MVVESHIEINENPHPEFVYLDNGLGEEDGTGDGCGMFYHSRWGSLIGVGEDQGMFLTGDDFIYTGIENNNYDGRIL